jgi:hypothetical protein
MFLAPILEIVIVIVYKTKYQLKGPIIHVKVLHRRYSIAST